MGNGPSNPAAAERQRPRSAGNQTQLLGDKHLEAARSVFEEIRAPLSDAHSGTVHVEKDAILARSLRGFFEARLPKDLALAFGTYFEEVAHNAAGVRLASVDHVSLTVFLRGIALLAEGSPTDRAAVLRVYESVVPRATPEQFVGDLATAALAFWECTGTSSGQKSEYPALVPVSRRFVDFIARKTVKTDADSPAPALTFDALAVALGGGQVHATRLWELVVGHLFFKPLSAVESAAASKESSQAALAEQLTLARNRGIRRPRFAGGRSSLLAREDVWVLDMALSDAFRTVTWERAYSTETRGQSWTMLASAVEDRGATLTIVRDADGHVFGGFAADEWRPHPSFYGTASCFLFSLQPVLDIFRPSGLNDNFQYYNHGTATLPNGLAMGGQLDYWAFYVGETLERGQSFAQPRSTTFSSPQLSARAQFGISALECWLVKARPHRDDDDDAHPNHSVLDRHPDAVAMLEMFGREMVSKQVREPDLTGDD